MRSQIRPQWLEHFESIPANPSFDFLYPESQRGQQEECELAVAQPPKEIPSLLMRKEKLSL
jgi:hypothetical protein